MGIHPKKIASGVLALVAISLSFIPFLSAQGDTTSALAYIASKPITTWGAMALAAAGQVADMSSFKNIDSTSAIDYEAPILALAAQGKNPRTYPDTDYLAQLLSFYDGTQIGKAAEVNDDIFGILALRAAGVAASDAAVAGAKSFILANQDASGGWPFAVGGTPDTNTTAAAITALIETGISTTDLAITKAVSYLKSAQNNDGGFPYDPVSPWGTGSDASSDAWVIIAANKLGEDPRTWTKNGNNPVDHLLTLQQPSGFFAWQAGGAEDSFSPATTAYATIALLGKSFPVAAYTQPAYASVTYRLAGATRDFCSGTVNAPNPLELIKIVAQSCNVDYYIKDLSFGPYVERIDTDTAAGVVGWMYTVNTVSPSVGAHDYVLAANDEVLWYFADYRDKVTRIGLASGQVNTGSAAVATVEYSENGSWVPLAGASVHAANTVVSTDANGQASLTLPDGSYKVFATASGYVRSEAETLVVGSRAENEFQLSATVPGGSGGGGGGGSSSGISFVLSAPSGETSFAFGSLSVGQAVNKTLTINNRGQQKIYVEALVSGSDLFRNYLTLNTFSWRNFNDTVDAVSAKNVTVGLTLPASYTSGGDKTGTLTIWATPTN